MCEILQMRAYPCDGIEKKKCMWDLSAINIDLCSNCVVCVLRLRTFYVFNINYMPSNIRNNWAPNYELRSFFFPHCMMFAAGIFKED
jgi:hypothetical protein